MKKNLYLYLFIFALLINVFTYVYFTNKEKFETGRIEKLQEKTKASADSLNVMRQQLTDAEYFALETNDNAMEYFAGQDIAALSTKITEGIMEYNHNKNGNPLVDYDPIDGQPFLINKVKILNHRWVIADFSNGKAWGEVLIKYFVDDAGKVSYETLESLIYSDTLN